MTRQRAITAAIIEAVPCDTCGAMPRQPCVSKDHRGRPKIWKASVHFLRRDRARRYRKDNLYSWQQLVRTAEQLHPQQHEEYLKAGGGAPR